MEKQQTWTQNDHYFISSKQCFEELLVKQLYGSGKASKPDDTAKNANGQTARQCVDAALAQLATAGIVLSAEDLDIAVAKKKRKAAEQGGSLLDLIAGTLAYFKVGLRVQALPGQSLHHEANAAAFLTAVPCSATESLNCLQQCIACCVADNIVNRLPWEPGRTPAGRANS